MTALSHSTIESLRRLDDFDQLNVEERFDALAGAGILDALVKDGLLTRYTKDQALDEMGVDPDEDHQVRDALAFFSRHEVWRGHASREEYYKDENVENLDVVYVLPVASATHGMDWDPTNWGPTDHDPYLDAVERLVVAQRREELGSIAQASRPQSDLASPDECLARRSRGRCM